MVSPKPIAAKEALKFFKNSIEVQTATPVRTKGEDSIERPGFKSKMERLAEEHVLSARDYGDRVTIVTLDGRRHEAVKFGKQDAATA